MASYEELTEVKVRWSSRFWERLDFRNLCLINNNLIKSYVQGSLY